VNNHRPQLDRSTGHTSRAEELVQSMKDKQVTDAGTLDDQKQTCSSQAAQFRPKWRDVLIGENQNGTRAGPLHDALADKTRSDRISDAVCEDKRLDEYSRGSIRNESPGAGIVTDEIRHNRTLDRNRCRLDKLRDYSDHHLHGGNPPTIPLPVHWPAFLR
jgi:hypothetical protein